MPIELTDEELKALAHDIKVKLTQRFGIRRTARLFDGDAHLAFHLLKETYITVRHVIQAKTPTGNALLERLRKQATAVYLAADEGVAEDLSEGLKLAINEIKRLRAELKWFCDRVDAGEVRSTKTYARFKAILSDE